MLVEKLYLNSKYGVHALRVCHTMLSPFKLCKWMYLDINSMYPVEDYTRWVWIIKKDLNKMVCN